MPTLEDKTTAQEIALVYNNVGPNLSYNSLDCNIKLLKNIFPDETKTLTLGKTKAEALVLNVLSKKALYDVIHDLQNVFFSMQTDASNVKNRKYFPITYCPIFFGEARIGNCNANFGSNHSLFTEIQH